MKSASRGGGSRAGRQARVLRCDFVCRVYAVTEVMMVIPTLSAFTQITPPTTFAGNVVTLLLDSLHTSNVSTLNILLSLYLLVYILLRQPVLFRKSVFLIHNQLIALNFLIHCFYFLPVSFCFHIFVFVLYNLVTRYIPRIRSSAILLLILQFLETPTKPTIIQRINSPKTSKLENNFFL